MDLTRNFKSVRKNGYDASEVKKVFRDAETRMTELQVSLENGSSAVDKLERELADLRDALRRSNEKPTFADLGSAFEQTLRVAEEQAQKMVDEANADAKVLRDSARAEAEAVTRAARNNAAAILSQTEAEVEDQRQHVEREVSQLVMNAETLLVQANTLKETAQRREAALLAEAERDAADTRSRQHQEVEDVRTELETLRQIAVREQLRIEREIKLASEDAERERLARHEDAVRFIQEQTDEASEVMHDAEEQADQLEKQIAEFLSRAREDAQNLLSLARESATNLINQARSRAETITRLFDEHALDAMEKAQRRRDALERQREAMREFSLELKALASADAMVSLDESDSLND